MTPINSVRFNFYANKSLGISKSTNSIVNITSKVKAVALCMIPLIAIFFIYLLLSETKANKVVSGDLVSFTNLKLTDDDKKSIKFIIENVSQKSKWWLLKNRSKMNEHGDRIKNIHPFKFISFILSNQELKHKYLPKILNDKFKRFNFINGLANFLNEKHNNNHLKPYLVDFMKSLNIPMTEKGKLLNFISEKDWNSFFHYLYGKET